MGCILIGPMRVGLPFGMLQPDIEGSDFRR